MADIYYPSTVLFVDGIGVGGSTTILDMAYTPLTLTAVGDAQLSGTQYHRGNTSLKLDGVGDNVTFTQGTDFNFATGQDFTIDFWTWKSAIGSGAADGVIATSTSGATNGWCLYLTADGLHFNSGSNPITSTGATPNDSAWHHWALCRSGSTLRIFHDGVFAASITDSTNITGQSIGIIGLIGTGGTAPFAGYIQDLRVTRVARYTEDFTPPSTDEDYAATPDVTGDLDEALPALTAAGHGNYYADITLPSMYAFGCSGGDINKSLPALTLAAYAGASAAVTLPAMTAVGYGPASADCTLPALTFSAYGHDTTGENAAALTLPSFTLGAYGGANASLTIPSLTLEVSGTFDILGAADMTLPSLTLSANGFAGAVGHADLTFGNNLGTYSLVGYSGAVCSVTIGSLTLEASGTSGAVGNATLTLPLFELTASGTEQTYGSADMLMPAIGMGATAVAYLILPGFTLTAIGTAVVTATYEAYSINLNHRNPEANDEVTRYTNFPFTQIVRYQGSYFGVAADGLYLLEGTTDYAATPTTIPWAFKTAQTDFKEPKQKTVAAAYFGGRLGPAATVTLYAGEGAGVAYAHSTPRGATAQNYRQVFGKGVKARYYALGASGASTMELDGIEFDIHTLPRRI